jgi:malate dehydrogenase (oxaloacetate-decarboxylating)
LAKNDFLAALHDRNEILYYKLLGDHIEEMLPVVYDPVVAQAIERYSREFQRPNGVYLPIDDIDDVMTAFNNYGLGADGVDLLVATDAEEILGIGDWGANGMGISIGKLAVYTAAGRIDPDPVIPVMLDGGTDRESLLNDPLYVGNRHSRVRGERYDHLIKTYIETASRLFRMRFCTSRISALRTPGGSSSSTATRRGSSTTTCRARARSRWPRSWPVCAWRGRGRASSGL